VPHYDVLLVELAPVAAFIALALVGNSLIRALRLLHRCLDPCSNDGVVAAAAGVLLPHKRNRLPHTGTSYSEPNSAADTSANPAAHTSTNSAAPAAEA